MLRSQTLIRGSTALILLGEDNDVMRLIVLMAIFVIMSACDRDEPVESLEEMQSRNIETHKHNRNQCETELVLTISVEASFRPGGGELSHTRCIDPDDVPGYFAHLGCGGQLHTPSDQWLIRRPLDIKLQRS